MNVAQMACESVGRIHICTNLTECARTGFCMASPDEIITNRSHAISCLQWIAIHICTHSITLKSTLRTSSSS